MQHDERKQTENNHHPLKCNRLQGAPDARNRPASHTGVCEQADDKADGVPCDRLQKTKQLQEWSSQFGNDYIERNQFEEWKLGPGTEAFRRMIGGLQLESILEVGSNIGLNLIFINALFQGKVGLHAVEPNRKAYDQLVGQPINLVKAWNCDGFSIPLPDASMDLVYTNGVLIHIAPEDLGRLTDEIVRVSKRYVLCSEYFSHTPEERPYHGQEGLLYKRDFGSFYLDRHPCLHTVDYGFLWMREFGIFDNLNWWLFEKTAG